MDVCRSGAAVVDTDQRIKGDFSLEKKLAISRVRPYLPLTGSGRQAAADEGSFPPWQREISVQFSEIFEISENFSRRKMPPDPRKPSILKIRDSDN